MSFSLHPEIDCDALQRDYARQGWVAISPFLPDEQAQELCDYLLGRTDWRARLRDLDGRLFEPSPEELDEWGPQKAAGIRTLIAPRLGQKGFGYVHTRLRIIDQEGRRVEGPSLLAEFGEFLCSEQVFSLAMTITGESAINFADSFAARYDPGDYTTSHDDGVGNRKAA